MVFRGLSCIFREERPQNSITEKRVDGIVHVAYVPKITTMDQSPSTCVPFAVPYKEVRTIKSVSVFDKHLWGVVRLERRKDTLCKKAHEGNVQILLALNVLSYVQILYVVICPSLCGKKRSEPLKSPLRNVWMAFCGWRDRMLAVGNKLGMLSIIKSSMSLGTNLMADLIERIVLVYFAVNQNGALNMFTISTREKYSNDDDLQLSLMLCIETTHEMYYVSSACGYMCIERLDARDNPLSVFFIPQGIV
ncbi:hypothetical protein M513_05300 [Trichuris suis]|uniref:Uncharacterized protein n=1 Tax=Trichuris suis TaxID=68888 RepID=A0A085M998_9BILA|nr:hypothetical protein M513_05300 [Trichuris suis]